MLVQFYLRFSTRFGQTIFVSGNTDILGNDDTKKAFPLQYLNEHLWHATVEIEGPVEALRYNYILRKEDGEEILEPGDDRVISLVKITVPEIVALDTWNAAGDIGNVFYTLPFQQVLLRSKKAVTPGSGKKRKAKTYTHEFKVKAPLLNEGELLCIAGSAKALHDWTTDDPVLLSKEGNWWTIKVKLSKTSFPVTYKYGVYDSRKRKFLEFEKGDNRIVLGNGSRKKITVLHDGFAALSRPGWRGAGVAIPVFSLRSKNSFGTGEFTDIKLLTDWAAQTGLKMIQLLPLNDTTATHSSKDSYPYAAISAFALHPLYLNLQKVAGKLNAAITRPLAKKQKQLNDMPVMDYEQVMRFKRSAIKELYMAQKGLFMNDMAYFSFFELNRHWLVPYAAFCYLRDKYKTADFNQWRSNSAYDENAIQRLVSPSQKHYDDIAVHYFAQYHLHLQLKEATEYAHKNGIIVKGDIPIGIYRYSVDAWMEPGLYNLDAQAGAPPDDFAIKGQNWGFPTYNWKKMQEDNFTWWRQRFEQMSNYFDAFRIDHILGFFRIWSIPLDAVEGVLGRFVPAIPVHINEFFEKNITYDRHRYCKPYITDAVLEGLFGDETEAVKTAFLDGYELKADFDSQRKIEDHFERTGSPDPTVKQGLKDLISNIILFEEAGSQGQKFHFRIAMEHTSSFQHLDAHSQVQLKELYINYFYHRQDEFWRKEAMHKLPGLKRSTNMLICGEDLGMVPHCVPEVMEELGILSLEIQRMPKKSGIEFFHPKEAPYLSVVTPSTHDMSTVRSWWEEDKAKTQRFYNDLLGHYGAAPYYCEAWINKEILLQHLHSPAMWSVFQLQDILGMNEQLRREDPAAERINVPADPNHIWNYRMHLYLEDLVKETVFNTELREYVTASGR